MPALALRHAWLQKHPTPTAATGEFHWHPAEALGGAPVGDLAQASIAIARGDAGAPAVRARGTYPIAPAGPRGADPVVAAAAAAQASGRRGEGGDLRLALVDRLRGVVPPAALWQLAPGRVVWAQVFAATAPGDGRRYCGLAVTIAEAAGASAADLLASMLVPAAAPWDGEPSEREVELVRAAAAPLSSTQRSHRDTVLPAPGAVVRALISGGVAAIEDPARPDLPAWIASLEAWLPASIAARPRQGEWRGGAPRITDAADPAAAILLAAWCPTAADAGAAARTRRAWAILTELAASQGRSFDDVAVELSDDAGAPGADLARALTHDERAHLPEAGELAIEPWVHALHHWGRGRLDQSPDAATLVTRLADLVIARALGDHVAGRDERAAIGHVRWNALLPAARRREILAAIIARAPALSELIVATGEDPRRRTPTPFRRPEVTRA